MTTRSSHDDPIERLAARQVDYETLPLLEKVVMLQEMQAILKNLTMSDVVTMLGELDAQRMGLSLDTTEGQREANLSALTYIMAYQDALKRLLKTHQNHSIAKKLPRSPDSAAFFPQRQHHVNNLGEDAVGAETKGQTTTILQTFPLDSSDKISPFAACKVDLWLQPDTPFQPLALEEFFVDNHTTDSIKKDGHDGGKNGCMVVLGAGNHCFLSTIDCLHGLFQCNRVVYLKHHAVRNHHDPFLRILFRPIMERGYFDTELDTTTNRSQQIVNHPSVAHVHITGGKAVHDAIVWGRSSFVAHRNESTRILKAKMTSELGCVTPWIVAPNQPWTKKQLQSHVQHLFASIYSNAGANCNSPKVVVLPKDWPHAKEFVDILCQEMAKHPLPLAYYPGSKERWNSFRQAYPTLSKVYGDDSPSTILKRKLSIRPDGAALLPWLVVDGISVDLSTESGRTAAAHEYAFVTEPFAPVLTIAYTVDSQLSTAVALANDYLYGSLSCTLVAPESNNNKEVEQAIADLRYGTVAVNLWSGMAYLAPGGTWGAYPGEQLENVQSGIGQVHNYYCIRHVAKTVLRVPFMDPLASSRKPDVGAIKEYRAFGNLLLQPGPFAIANVVAVMVTGYELPRNLFSLTHLGVGIAVAVVVAAAMPVVRKW